MLTVSSYQKNYLPLLTKKAGDVYCPLCNTAGKLEITFYQLQVETSGGTNNTKQISTSVFCNGCLHDIPNVRWTKDLHHFYETEKKKINVKISFKTKRSMRIALRILLGFVLFIVGIMVFAMIINYAKQH